ncbi:MAG: FkbM family methyltransferase [Ruminococcus sp.]|nr:FkbM family methyltransferase [Ruminococcus sp.]
MASVIFYGAGRNACEKFGTWVNQGLKPACFVDADVKKHHTEFREGLMILPLLEAVEKYPDYELYCTQAPAGLFEVRTFLLGIGVPEEKIKFCEDIGGGSVRTENRIYHELYCIYQALQDDLSRAWFWGRAEYSLSHSLAGIYRAMLCDEHLKWVSSKQTYGMQRYGLPALWELLKENYPVQKHKIWLLAFNESWNEYDWVVERFLEAIPELGIKISGCVMPYASCTPKEFKGLVCISEEALLSQIDENTRIIIGFPGWCLQTKDVVGRYEAYKNILFPIADTGHPQYMEPDIFPPAEKEIYVDVGVYDLQNSIDFSKWAVKGYEKIYAFEPDPQCFQHSLERLNEMGDEFQRKMELVQKGLSDVNGILEFPSEYKGSGIYGEGGTISVEVVSLDSYLNGRPVTLVKMDVEGAEMNVLLGMRETILRYKPRLEICVYHKHEDLFEIASFLLDLVPEYKFYLRHYNSNETETVLFCMV